MLNRILPWLVLTIAPPLIASDAYDAEYSARFEPAAGRVTATIRIRQSAGELRLLDFSAPPSRYSDFRGDGEIEREGGRIRWQIPAKGGRLEYSVTVDHLRGRRHDARMTADWAVLRLDDIFPPARAVGTPGAESRASLALDGPKGWTFESRYGPVRERIPTPNPDRRFDRPTGWLSAGRQGVRRDAIGGREITVAGPRNQGLRRLDILAFLQWTLPELIRVFPDFPEYVLIVGAEDGMWRGALSGPDSMYVHSDRPLISENGTSTLLHEMVHIATGSVRGPREDWIIEGLADWYALEALRRSGGLSAARHEHALRHLARWAEREDGGLESPSRGADTAYATLVFRDLDRELRRNGGPGLDPVARRLLRSRRIDGPRLRTLTEEALEHSSKVLERELGPAPDDPP